MTLTRRWARTAGYGACPRLACVRKTGGIPRAFGGWTTRRCRRLARSTTTARPMSCSGTACVHLPRHTNRSPAADQQVPPAPTQSSDDRTIQRNYAPVTGHPHTATPALFRSVPHGASQTGPENIWAAPMSPRPGVGPSPHSGSPCRRPQACHRGGSSTDSRLRPLSDRPPPARPPADWWFPRTAAALGNNRGRVWPWRPRLRRCHTATRSAPAPRTVNDLSGSNHGWAGGGQLPCPVVNVPHGRGLITAGRLQQGVDPGDHQGGVNTGGVIERLVGRSGACLRLTFCEQGRCQADPVHDLHPVEAGPAQP